MTDHSHIDEAFREHQRDWEKAPADMVWHRLTDRLDDYRPHHRQKKNTIFRIGMAAALVMVFGLAFMWYHSLTPNTAEIAGVTDHSLEEIEVTIPSAHGNSAEADAAPDRPALAAGTPVDRESTVNNATTTLSSPPPVRQAEVEAAGAEEQITDAVEAETAATFIPPGEAIAEREVQEESMEDAMVNQPGNPVKALADQAERSAAKTASASRENKKRESRNEATANSYRGGEVSEAIGGPEAEMEQPSDFVRESLTILVPATEESKCAQSMIYVEADRYYTSACPMSTAAIKQTAPVFPDREDPLLRLLNGKEAFAQDMETYGADENCETEERITLIYGFGTDLSALKDTVIWPANPSCLSENASLIYLRIKEILSMGK